MPEDVQSLVALAQAARQQGDRPAALTHFLAAAAAAPERAVRHLDVGDELRELGRLDEADAAYQRAIALEPGFAQAYVGLAHCARRRGDHPTALTHFLAAAEAAPERAVRHFDVGDELRALGRLDEAEAAYRRAIALEPGFAQAHAGLGHCARCRGDRLAALARFSAAAEAAPEQAVRHLDVGDDLRELGRLEEAETAYERAVALDAGNAPARLGLALCKRARRDFAGAMADLLELRTRHPGLQAVRLNFAGLLLETGQLDEAAQEYRAVLTHEPGNMGALLGLGYCARARGDRAMALSWFSRASTIAPTAAQPRLEIAIERRIAGELDSARAAAQSVLDSVPDNVPALVSLGHTERQAGQHEAAQAVFLKAHALRPADASLLTELALTEKQLGNQAASDTYLDQALALAPLLAPAINLLGEKYLVSGDYEKARDIFSEAARTNPTEPGFTLGLAEALASSGHIDEALALLEAAEPEAAQPAPLRAKRLVLLRKAGLWREALALARQSTRQFSDHFPLWEERFAIENQLGTGRDIQDCLTNMPARSAGEKARRLRCLGQSAEMELHLSTALGFYEEGAKHNGIDLGVQNDLVRANLLAARLDKAHAHLRRACALEAPNTRLRGRSLNISQTQFGQILDDYRIDHVVATQIGHLQNLPPKTRAQALACLVSTDPNNTLAAVTYLIALRQGGVFDAFRPAANTLIPKVITQYWHEPETPADVAALMASWNELNPGYTTERFDDAKARAYLQTHFPRPVLDAYLRGREPAQRADIFRLARMFRDGGVYADADDRCLTPLDAWLPEGASLVLYQDEFGTIANNFIAAAPGHPLIKATLEMGVTAINRGDSDFLWLSTGPGLWARTLAATLVRGGVYDELPEGFWLLHRREIFRHVAVRCTAAYQLKPKARRPAGRSPA